MMHLQRWIKLLNLSWLVSLLMGYDPKTFQAAVQSALAEKNLRKRFQLRTNETHSGTMRNEEPWRFIT